MSPNAAHTPVTGFLGAGLSGNYFQTGLTGVSNKVEQRFLEILFERPNTVASMKKEAVIKPLETPRHTTDTSPLVELLTAKW